MKLFPLALCLFLCATINVQSQKRNQKKENKELIHDSLSKGLQWRNIGPFRGGRSVASTGVTGDPQTYYMGSTGGGVWKTQDAGLTWKNISDGYFKTGTVGAIAVSESDTNVVVVGMGEHAARGVMTSMGDGVYKSMDAGRTWQHLGLERTRHISDVIIHPKNPDVIYVSAQGAQYGPSDERGVYKTIDGGKTWEKILYINEITGASALSMDYNNPRILYAAMWQHQRYPWYMESGGEHSGIYKSVDGGANWEQLTTGLPDVFGKVGISVSRANSDRVYAVVEAEGEKAGVYRSDNAGKTWTQTNKDRVNITRSWYYMEIYADPQNEDIVYVLNAPVMKSIDGGKSFSNIPVPHGDNHHLWINPDNNKNLINSNDGGANISFNGGKSWSTQKNQPTAQFYRVITDNRFPYYVYGGQQDNTTVAIASRTRDAGIGWKDWYPTAGGESAFLAFDPDNPKVVYGGTYQGNISKWLEDSKTQKPIKQYPELGLSIAPKDSKYRYNWNAPIISSPHDRNTIYHAGNLVFKTTDGGVSWETVSPDLTKNETEKHGPGGGPFTNEAAGGENYNTITTLVESQHEEGVMYAGTDDGLLHITKNGGQSWQNITPKGIEDGIVNSVDVSEHDPATAYMVIMRYKSMDLNSYVYKTTNYGESWKKITNGLDDANGFARVVRADKIRKGLLYAGTETGLYVSFNDGVQWQKLQLNLPIVPINDLTIQDNDLVAATAGRGFWILDDLSALQQLTNTEEFQFFKPKDNYRFFGGTSQDANQGTNPKSGVAFQYFIPKGEDSLDLKLEILKAGEVIRSFTNVPLKEFKSWPGGPSKPEVLPSHVGLNKFTWDLTTESLPPIEKVFVFGGLGGHSCPPGDYTARLTHGTVTLETDFKLLADPSIDASQDEYDKQFQALETIASTIKDIHQSVINMRSAKSQLKHYNTILKDKAEADALKTLGEALIERIDSWENNLIQPKQKTFQDVINFKNMLNAQLINLMGYIDGEHPVITDGAKERLNDLISEWEKFKNEHDAIIDSEMKTYNATFKSLGLPAIILNND
ncbi:WD40/YVTN/BNR-like repeat-containing protein [uncultured Winogradskyella sp.]|uniref:WD40/YVTN/BNR-like repeat-containing protein n=1 Tax=uncultured Winogradskyella sp. TaxID=395353 RepID=UPI0035142FBF